jgi:hypothetical protein
MSASFSRAPHVDQISQVGGLKRTWCGTIDLDAIADGIPFAVEQSKTDSAAMLVLEDDFRTWIQIF